MLPVFFIVAIKIQSFFQFIFEIVNLLLNMNFIVGILIIFVVRVVNKTSKNMLPNLWSESEMIKMRNTEVEINKDILAAS
jgi:hypothetical protein